VRTRLQRALFEQTTPKAYKIIPSPVNTARAFAESERTLTKAGVPNAKAALTDQIIVSGKLIPITDFHVHATRKGVDAEVWGVSHVFQRSFQQKFKGGFRARPPTWRPFSFAQIEM
jgi:hypothetical protein